MRQAGPHQGSPAYQDSKDYLQPQVALIGEILDEVEKIETGAENPNVATDFLRADGTPKLS